MDQPNILIFMTDQQRGDSVPPYSRAHVPNLEQFAKEGVVFSQAFCCAPHCCPSRASFFSGLYPSEHGVWNNVNVPNSLSQGLYAGVRLWSQDLAAAGYEMVYYGKWHVSGVESPRDRGWGRPRAEKQTNDYDYQRPSMKEWQQYTTLERQDINRNQGQILRPGYPSYFHYGEDERPFNDQNVVDAAVAVIRNRTSDQQPWCQFIGTLGPHDPYFVPREFLEMYDLNQIELPESFSDTMADKPGLYRKMRDRFDQMTPEEHRQAIRHYLAFCTYEDFLFGQILAALDEAGQVDNTLVIYLSDHGDYMGEHGLWAKGLPPFRSAYHIPAMMRWPAGQSDPGRVVDALVSITDFAPTILEAVGLQATSDITGSSLVPYLQNQAPAGSRRAMFTQTNGNELYGIQRSVMTKEWKYVYNGFDYDELYDLQADPGETKNLMGSQDLLAVVGDLSQMMWQFAHATNDVCVNSYIATALAPFGPGVAFASTDHENLSGWGFEERRRTNNE